jgi:signal transduction histidine kinase
MATLARAQERELRDWLYGTASVPGMLHSAIRDSAERIEQEYDVPVDVVVVGDDAAITDRTTSLSQATAEAITNAAKHSGTATISVYVETGSDQIEVFVTDRGSGFDRDSIPADRHGIESSIVGRMKRAGGGAEISSVVDEGTEVRLWIRP